ncbi:MAG: sulfotransferase [Sphingobium sp.]
MDSDDATLLRLLSGDLRGAYDAALRQLAEDRGNAAAWSVMAAIALEGGNGAKARDLAEKALALDGDALLGLIVAGRAALLDRDEARVQQAATRLSALPVPAEPRLADMIGVLLVRAGRAEAALPYMAAAVRAMPESAEMLYNLAITAQFCGDLPRARESFRRLLVLDPMRHSARLALAQLDPPNAAALAEAERLFAKALDADAALQLGHSAARIAEGLGDDRGALDWLDRAKAAKAAEASHDPAAADALFAALQALPIDRSAAVDAPVRPLFVVGMPRSGTTLIDRILSSHAEIRSAGELGSLSNAVKRAAGTPGAMVLDAATLAAPFDPAEVASRYRADLAARGYRSGVVIDKMPFNFFYVAHILAALPEARVLIVRRDPCDTAFANYRQLFATEFGYYGYSYDLMHCARFVARFEALMDHVASAGAPRVATVHYEAVVADQEGESRRLIDWLGLEWDAACLSFDRNAAPVSTASSLQVRKPIYDISIGRWRRYGDRGAAVRDAIARWRDGQGGAI